MRRLAAALALSLAAGGPAGVIAIPTASPAGTGQHAPARRVQRVQLPPLGLLPGPVLRSDASRLPGDAFGLSLTYRTRFSRAVFVPQFGRRDARISGRPEAAFAAARQEMAAAFREVTPGDRITAWRAAPDRLLIFVNGQETGTLTREVDLLLRISLAEETRHPEGRAALLGGRCDG